MPKDLPHKIAVQTEVTNPGEFFACCGLLEIADRLSAGALGWFEGTQFCLAPQDPAFPISINHIMWSLVNVEVKPLSDESVAPLALGQPFQMRLDWWLMPNERKANRLKTWAGNQKSMKMFCKWQMHLRNSLSEDEMELDHLYQETCFEQGPYGFDSRTGWNALSTGFSLNAHTPYKKLPTRPAVEVLSAVGLQRSVPQITERNNAVFVSYSTWNAPLSPAVARLAVLGLLPGVTSESLETRIVKRGSYKGLDTAVPQRGDSNA